MRRAVVDVVALCAMFASAVGVAPARFLARSTATARVAETGFREFGAVVWEPVTLEGAARARLAVESLKRPNAPIAVTLRAGDLALFVHVQLAEQLPRSARDIAAAIVGERFYVRATVSPKELGDVGVLGIFVALLSDNEPLMFGGSFEVIRPGLVQFRVADIRLRSLPLPAMLIPQVLRQVDAGPRPAGLANDGLALEIPEYIASVRIEGLAVAVGRRRP